MSVSTADFNGDGKADLVLTSQKTISSIYEQVSLLLSNGDGTFQEQTIISGNNSGGTYSVAVGDFNGDGRPDIATASNTTPTVTVLQDNLSASTSFTTNTFTASFNPYFTVAADLNGDGNSDLVLADGSDYGNVHNHLETLRSNGNGTFAVASNQTFATTYSFHSISIADLNGDGYPDIVLGNEKVPVPNAPYGVYYQGAATVYLNNGPGNAAGTFNTTPKQTFFDGGDAYQGGESPDLQVAPNAVALTDVNSDGKPDFLAADGGILHVMQGNGDGTFASQNTSGTGYDNVSVAIANFGGDSTQDIAVTGDDAPGSDSFSSHASILLGSTSGKLGDVQAIGTMFEPETLVAADFNGDGQEDFAVLGQDIVDDETVDELQVSLLKAHEDGSLYSCSSTDYGIDNVNGFPDGHPSMAIGEFNQSSTFSAFSSGPDAGEWFPDIVAVGLPTEGGTGRVVVLTNNGDGGFSTTSTLYTESYQPFAVVVGDFNGDGVEDIAAISHSHVSVFLGKSVMVDGKLAGNGEFYSTAVVSSIDPVGYSINLEGYTSNVLVANLDGHESLVIGGDYDAQVQVLIGCGGGSFDAPAVVYDGPSGGLAVADLNGDGNPDIVMANQAKDTVSVLLGNSNGTFQPPQEIASLNFEPYGIVAEQFNADGTVKAADFNGDGRPDIVVTGYGDPPLKVPMASILLNTTPQVPTIDKWTGTVSHSWGTSGNWTNGVPTSSTTTYIQHESYTIDVDGSYSVGSLSSNSAIEIQSGGTLKLYGPAVISDNQNMPGLTVDSGGELDLNGNYATVDGLSGAGTVDDVGGGWTPRLTVDNTNTGSAATTTFSGVIQNTSGKVSLFNTSGTLVLTGTNTYGDNTGIYGGLIVVSTQTALPSGTQVVDYGTLQVNAGTGTASAVVLGSTGNPGIIGAGSLIIGVNSSTVGYVQLASLTGMSMLDSLTINSGSTLNMTSDAMLINYGSATDPATTIRGYLVSGYNSDTWTGTGIDSSIAAANINVLSVGYADGGTSGGGAVGVPVEAYQVLIKFTVAGDANLNGIVNFPDELIISQNYGKTGQDWEEGDLNYDGIVNFPDLLLVAQTYGKTLAYYDYWN